MAEHKGVTIQLTEKQRQAVSRATGEEHVEIRLEKTPLESKMAPRVGLRQKSTLSGKAVARKATLSGKAVARKATLSGKAVARKATLSGKAVARKATLRSRMTPRAKTIG